MVNRLINDYSIIHLKDRLFSMINNTVNTNLLWFMLSYYIQDKAVQCIWTYNGFIIRSITMK